MIRFRLITALFVLMVCQVWPSFTEAITPVAVLGQTASPKEATGQNVIQASEVSLETPTGTLYGTLLLPAGQPPFPVVLIIAGSGVTDRDGNSAGLGKSDELKMLAEGFAKNGIAALRYDKRSVGKSAPARPKNNTFEVQVDDAASWIAWLGQSPRFRAVGVVGHSEGGLTGMMAAQRGGVRAFVSLAGPGHRFDEVLSTQMGNSVRSGQLSQAAVDAMRRCLVELRAGRTVENRPPDVPPALWTVLFQPRAQEYLISIFRYDPVAEIAKLPPKGVQVLVVQGTTDLTGGKDHPILLATAIGAKPVMIEGMNHALKSAPLDPVANDKASENARLPLAPGLLEQLIPFLRNALK